MPRFALELSYDGTSYHGWQRQNNASTVQQSLEEALSTLLRTQIAISGCGRTDTGVHASQFIAHFDFDGELSDQFRFRMNGLLPLDISVQKTYVVPSEFNARFDATSRRYLYHMIHSKNPFGRDYTYYYSRKLDLPKIEAACAILKKAKEFGAFCKSHAQNKTNRCEIFDIAWTREGERTIFQITANRFLRNMVRAIVGTLIEIGENKITIQEFEHIIESQNRQEAGFSVPAKGLFLERIEYDRTNWKQIN